MTVIHSRKKVTVEDDSRMGFPQVEAFLTRVANRYSSPSPRTGFKAGQAVVGAIAHMEGAMSMLNCQGHIRDYQIYAEPGTTDFYCIQVKMPGSYDTETFHLFV